MNDIIVGLDIGTSKTCAIIAKVNQGESIEILGVGKAPSMGLHKGDVRDVDRTVNSLKDSTKQAEGTSGLEILRGFAGVSGQALKTVEEEFEVDVPDQINGVTNDEISRLRELSSKYAPPRGRRLILNEPMAYSIDGQRLGLNPEGGRGERLKLKAAMFLAGAAHSEDIYRIINGSRVEVMGLFPNPVASAEAVLDENEKSLGCMVVDIGGGTSDVVVYHDGVPHYATVIKLGGDHFDSDLARGLAISLREAERIKINFGSVKPEDLSSDEVIEIAQSGGGSEYIPVKIIAEILAPRIEEIFELLGESVNDAGAFKGLKAGLVLTGGTSLIGGCAEKAGEVLGLQARIGFPHRLAGLSNDVRNPIFATGVGLIKLGFKQYLRIAQESNSGIIGNMKKRVVSSNWWKALTK